MKHTKPIDYTGHSHTSLPDAINNALDKAGEHAHFNVIETQCSHHAEANPRYEVLLVAYEKESSHDL